MAKPHPGRAGRQPGSTGRQTILVTGGAGFIGTNFIRYVFRTYPKRYRIINLDALTYAGNRSNLAEYESGRDYQFVKGDICDARVTEPLIRRSDYVVNFAAETHVDRSIQEAGQFIQTDVYGVYNLLRGCLKHPVRRFIHVSTDEVYGEAHAKPCRESDGFNPKSPYAASKAGGDRVAFSFHATYGLPVVITRCVNNFGPYQYPEKMIPLFITNCLEGRKMPVYGNGENIREWIHVDDHCNAIMFLLRHRGEISGEAFNVGTGIERDILQNARLIEKHLGIQDGIEFVPDRLGHILRHAVNSAKLRKLGWKGPARRFEADFADTVKWYVDNRTWWERIKHKDKDFKKYYRRQYGERT